MLSVHCAVACTVGIVRLRTCLHNKERLVVRHCFKVLLGQSSMMLIMQQHRKAAQQR
jgi:hypothetical protein